MLGHHWLQSGKAQAEEKPKRSNSSLEIQHALFACSCGTEYF